MPTDQLWRGEPGHWCQLTVATPLPLAKTRPQPSRLSLNTSALVGRALNAAMLNTTMLYTEWFSCLGPVPSTVTTR